MRFETVIVLAFTLLLGTGAVWILGPAGIGGLLIALGLGIWVWFLLLRLILGLPDIISVPILMAVPWPGAKIYVLLFMVGLVLIVLGFFLVSLDPRTQQEAFPIDRRTF